MEAILINGENDTRVCYLKLNSYLLVMFLPPIGSLATKASVTIFHDHSPPESCYPYQAPQACGFILYSCSPIGVGEFPWRSESCCWPHAATVTAENTQRGLQEEQWYQTLTRTCWTYKQLEHLATYDNNKAPSPPKNKAKRSHNIFGSELIVHALYSLSGSPVLLPLFPRAGFEISSYRCS